MGYVFGKQREIQFCVSGASINRNKLLRKNYDKNIHEMHSCTEKDTKKEVKFQLMLYL